MGGETGKADRSPILWWADYYLRTGGQFPDRLGVIGVVIKLQADLNDAIREWACWALATVDEWPDDLRQAPLARDALDEIRRRGAVVDTTAGRPAVGHRPYPPDFSELSR